MLVTTAPAAFQYEFCDSKVQDRCHRLERFFLIELDRTSHRQAAIVPARRRGSSRGHFIFEVVLVGAKNSLRLRLVTCRLVADSEASAQDGALVGSQPMPLALSLNMGEKLVRRPAFPGGDWQIDRLRCAFSALQTHLKYFQIRGIITCQPAYLC